MKNEVKYEPLSIIKTVFDAHKSDDSVFIAEIDGSKIMNLQDFLRIMSEAFIFPYLAKSQDSYNDWMRDLDWLNKDEYLLIIYNFDELSTRNPELRDIIVNGFSKIILPFWESEVIYTVVEGESKPFNVYLAVSSN